jgi:hypothetical protein
MNRPTFLRSSWGQFETQDGCRSLPCNRSCVFTWLAAVALLSVNGYTVLNSGRRWFQTRIRTCSEIGSEDSSVLYNTKQKGYNEGDEIVRNLFGRRRSRRSRTVGGGPARRGRTAHGGTSSGTIELAIGTLVIIVLVVVLLRLLGLL